MKENRKNNYLIKYVVVLAILIAMTILACAIPKGIGLIDNDMLQDISNSGLTNTSFNVNYPTSGELGQFDNGVTYVYTDPEKIDDFRAGTISSDITEVTIDTTQPHGTSQANPYVISTLADWETFAKKMATSSSYGAGQYFVLANDLDFSSVTFHPIPIFRGTFNGIGYQLLNITASTNSWQYWNGADWTAMGTFTTAGFGIFCRTDSATITDLIVQDYYMENIPSTNALSWGNYHGALIGLACGNENILNCHLQGEMNDTNISYSNYVWLGGIVGIFYKQTSSNPLATLYRCSANSILKSATVVKSCTHMGGLVGETGAGVYANIYDCADWTDFQCGLPYYSDYTGSPVSVVREAGRVDVVDYLSNTRTTSTKYVATFNPHTALKLLKNAYADAVIGTSGTIPFAVNNPTTSSNVHIGPYVNKPSITAVTKYSTSDDLLDAVRNDVGVNLPDNIWDASKISARITPDTSPVRNFLTANVTFKNLLSGGGEEGVGIATAEYRAGDALPSPSGSYLKTNHTFRGWTTDKTGKSDPVTELPTGVFGDVTYYAVWGLTDSYVASQIKT
ncbi:MAG: InlB B-repeat-containing protein, partial [Clostridia bacterium]|nr:InlB B-repeat-containing protein [Clostridia bacterium]